MKQVLAVALAALAVGGCSKKPTEGGVRLEQVSEAFSSAGLKVQSFQPTDATRFAALKCMTGNVEGVDTMVCEYGSPEARAAAHKAGEQWAGNATTAAVLGNGRTLLAVADRAHGDPNGKAIHKITQAFVRAK